MRIEQDIREPSLRQHELAMERGSKELLKALLREHPRLVTPLPVAA